MKIYENFLPEELYRNLYSDVNNSHLHWKVGEELYEDDILLRNLSYNEEKYEKLVEESDFASTDYRFDIQNVMMFRDYHGLRPEIKELPIIGQVQEYIDKTLSVKIPLRMKLNMSFCNDINRVNSFHVDISFLKDIPHKTAVLYINDNNGGTFMENGEFVKSEANKLVVFDSNIYHAPVTQTDTKKRFVLNYNFIN